MAQSPRGEVELRYTSGDGEDVVTTLAAARAESVAAGLPVRRFSSYAGMSHYPGWWWSATMGDLVGYESLLERDCLMLADFDRDVVAISSQPFGITGWDGDTVRRHVPDYLLVRRDGSVQVIDVKPVEFVEKPEVAEVLAWTGRVVAGRGWQYSVWSGAAPVRLTNIRFLAQGRRPRLVDPAAVTCLVDGAVCGMSLTQALAVGARRGTFALPVLRAAMLRVLWRQVWRVDLDAPLSGESRIEEVEEVDGVRVSA